MTVFTNMRKKIIQWQNRRILWYPKYMDLISNSFVESPSYYQSLCWTIEIRAVERGICPIAKSTNERTVSIIMTGCITYARNSHITTSALISDVTIVFLNPDFLGTRKFWQSAINKGYSAYFSLCMRETAPYFYFRSKIWRHHRVPCSWFLQWRENVGDSRTFKADMWLHNICMGFQDLLA